jgi:hypothetical protein
MVPALCTWQGQPTAYSSSSSNPNPRAAIHTSADGFRYLFTMVDRSCRWLEATPLKSMAADDCVVVLILTLVARFGVPTVLTSDQGN